ncbi:DNA endonuclease RBBP8 [Micropterus dolomieu]|uniref:DNA endonuclease RBBP8 n=1 Tax=Micropterus dolomieu TaxID=147949 RepID=UPI001E8EE86A|nr:DNA endonuclease RBBP8 [Micropterus dolomieu]
MNGPADSQWGHSRSDSRSKVIVIAMECFNNLLLKLREVHEREVEGWQMKMQELSNKKGCDTKRMEELFTKNQQMKEQQRLLTENIKTLENRLRAGLCDRCTVTQEVAKRRQQEFEASQIQSLQHISLLAGEMNNLKKENKRLRDEIRNIRATLNRGHSEHPFKRNTTTDVKPNSTTDLSHSSGPVALVTAATNRASHQPADGTVEVKSEGDQRAEEVNHNRHVLHPTVPCRPQPIMSSPVTLPWPLSESPDWAAGTSMAVPPNLPHFPNLVPTSQHASPGRQVFGSSWHKQSTHQPPAREPTVLFRLRSLSEHVESQTKSQEKKELPPSKEKSVSGDVFRETCEVPLDLSERGKSKPSQTPRDDSPIALQGDERAQKSPDKDVKTNPPAHGPVSSPTPVVSPSSSSTQQVEEPTSDHNHKQVKEVKEQEQKEEVNGKTDQNNRKKVPVLTISLRPVVVLETLNSALKMHESLPSNGKSSSPAAQPESNSDEQDKDVSVSGQESVQGCKRKRASVETETDRDSDINNIQQERKIKITVISEKKSPS